MDSKRRKTGDQDVSALRLASRQKYLAEREAQQLALLRRQVAEEAEEEERLGNKLSEKERAEFKKNRQTLELAEARNAIDDSGSGFQIPDAEYSNKNEALTRRHKDTEVDYKSEYQLWEQEQLSKIKSQPKSADVQEQDYELVFDPSQNVVYDGPMVDLEKQRLEMLVDEAEKHAASIEEVRRSLPVYQYKDEFIKALQTEQILVFVGETGSGKTTQLTQFLFEAGFAAKGRIGCTQPRRVAAMSVAKRVAEEAGVRLGKEVGFQVRFEEKFDKDATKIVYLTDGLLLRQALTSPLLEEYSVIILDEAHERTIATDVLMVLTREITRCRPDFRLVIASATLNAQFFSEYFDNSPILSCPGRSFPITKFFTEQPEANYLSAALTTFWQIHASQPKGDVLIFFTGEDEIIQAVESIEATAKKLGNTMAPVVVAPVYGSLPSHLQSLIFDPVPNDETSLTIDGIVYVIDSGLVKQKRYDARLGTETLSVVPTSRASVLQRAGRAGRTGPGLSFHLYTRYAFYNELPAQTEPEILRSALDSLILILKSMGINDILNFDLPSQPSGEAMIASLENLYALQFLTSEGQVSKLGRRASELPLDPKLAKVLLAADSFGCVDEMVTLAALVSEGSTIFFSPKDKKAAADLARQRFASEHGDMISLLNLWNEFEETGFSKSWCQDNFVQYRSLSRVIDVRDQLFRLCDKVEIERSSCGITDHVKIMKSWTSAYFANTARLNKDGMSYRCLSSRNQVWIHPSSCLRDKRPRLVCYFEQVETSKSWMRTVAPIEASWLNELAPHFFKKGQLDDLDVGKKMGKGVGKVGVDR
ncbi:P-loop containing nucleoside triphosphate hydrolase protein [Alternaria rosae]|uniref:P-loop containing nucleoside triphosphate hydrolase protein n=1 Tax=Alternaria rosae TaxID=1187941 RepID=UPI001E8D56E0|nr:P-loop containing nucleoside triphosphate hydrolase protein [Alternaria rosae]KAH6851425.1 P-loop containing nucleoside triphosphate hydrolase protein [Alternaria rosae]